MIKEDGHEDEHTLSAKDWKRTPYMAALRVRSSSGSPMIPAEVLLVSVESAGVVSTAVEP